MFMKKLMSYIVVLSMTFLQIKTSTTKHQPTLFFFNHHQMAYCTMSDESLKSPALLVETLHVETLCRAVVFLENQPHFNKPMPLIAASQKTDRSFYFLVFKFDEN